MRGLLKSSGMILMLSFCLLFSACGKNEPIANNGTGTGSPYYYPQAPVPPNGGYYPPPGGYPPGGNGGGYFNPQMPQGMPNQYTPWLPIDNYFRYRQQPQAWVNIWMNWQYYAQYRGYNQYDFSGFWFDYCPNQLSGTQFQPVYNYFDTNVYYWIDYNTQFQCDDPSYFWQNYQGMPYSNVDSYCGGGCY